MKKILVLLMVICLALTGTALADRGGEGGNTGCNGQGNPNSPCGDNGGGGDPDPDPNPDGDGFASIDVSAQAAGSGLDFDLELVWGKGVTQGFAKASGNGEAGAQGSTENGIVFGDVTATGGGLAGVDTFVDTVPNTDSSFVIGTNSTAFSAFGGSVDIGVSGNGAVSGYANGSGTQITEAASAVGRGANESFGVTAQGSMGGFEGTVEIEARDRTFLDGSGEMTGYSYSNSYNYTNDGTVGYGTNVGSGTEVITNTGFGAGGMAMTETAQRNGSGVASSSAKGTYSGSGSGVNFNGSSVGYTGTTLTTLQGMNGTIATGTAGMKSTATISGGQPQ